MEKIPVLIICDPESELGEKILDTLSILSFVKVQWAVDLSGVELQLQQVANFAFVVIDNTTNRHNSSVIAQCIRDSDKENPIPLFFVIGEMDDVDHLYNVFGSGVVDYLFEPISANILKNKAQLFCELHRLKFRVEQQAVDFDAKILEFEVLHKELEEKRYRLEQLSSIDSLTGLFNRYYFDENLHKEWRQAVRENDLLSLLFIDVDYLKVFNEYYGHREGDDCLREMAGVLYHALLRPVDIVARYGGDQFAAILPNTDALGASLVAKRMMENVSSLKRENFASLASTFVTISIGGATALPTARENIHNFIDKADNALTEAKMAGRNRICLSS